MGSLETPNFAQLLRTPPTNEIQRSLQVISFSVQRAVNDVDPMTTRRRVNTQLQCEIPIVIDAVDGPDS